MGKAELVFQIFIAAAIAAIAVMVFLANYRSRDPVPQAEVVHRGYALRRYWFWIVLVVAVVTFAISIPDFPYQARGESGARHIGVVAQQYGFTIAGPVPRDRPVVFDVSSRDVNHGFAIYAPDGRLVSQVQAMPGYVNHLPVRFSVPGHYTIKCLEYCGIAHAAMQGGFDVR